jgi:hypothetical protein
VPLVAADPRAIGPINASLAQAGSWDHWPARRSSRCAVGWAGWTSAPVLLMAIAAVGAACARRQAALDPLLDHQEPRLAGDRREAPRESTG